MSVTREALYDEVWAEPMTTVAARYAVSSSFLARAFAARGVGVVAATAPIAYLDVDLLGELDGKP